MSSEKIRVLFFDHQAELGGGEFSLYELLRNLDRGDFEPLLLLGCEGPFKEKAEELGLEVRVLNIPEKLRSLKRDPQRRNSISSMIASAFALPDSMFDLYKALKDYEADILCFNSVKSACIGVCPARLAGAKSVWILRDCLTQQFYSGYSLTAVKLLTAGVSRVIAVSDEVRRQYQKLTDAGTDRADLVYNGVDLERFKPGADGSRLRAELGLEGKDVVSLVGRLEPWKGQRDFIEAAARVSEERDDVAFLIVGGPLFGREDYERECRELAEEMHLDNVFFLGFRDDMPGVYAASDLVVHASNLPEPFGRDVVEAMASGKPVISTNIGGPLEIITEDAGVLVEPSEPGLMAEAILDLLSEPNRMKSLAEKARSRAEDSFDISIRTREIEEVFRGCVS
ncbi:MAG: glycosyltransferase [Candidatus Altiarchaeales archaeon]|nr:glycosyltransferase [Candidatus Altiarchaeales archaeon]MBD3415513.1 glycosyltransferase [Candidatus Altiarchaeales archaeon]